MAVWGEAAADVNLHRPSQARVSLKISSGHGTLVLRKVFANGLKKITSVTQTWLSATEAAYEDSAHRGVSGGARMETADLPRSCVKALS